jgi:hypothetical protein
LSNDSPSHAGDSAEREYQRRQRRRIERARERYGRVGAFAATWIGDPSTEAWRQGAAGEQHTARQLARHLRHDDVTVIHDRLIPGRGRANIDHITIGPAGIIVIDTKSTLRNVELITPRFSREDVLRVNGRDRTSQLDGVERQIETVRRALQRAGVGDIAVSGALCYPFMRRRWLHQGSARGGLITVDQPRQIAKRARRPGRLSPAEIRRLVSVVEHAFPPA